jgi:Ring finger domain
MFVVVVIQTVFIALVVMSLCCSCFCLSGFVLVAWVRGGFRLQHPNQMKPATKDMIDALEEITYTVGEEFVDDTTTCVICLEEYVDQEKLNILPCRHHFHPNCIKLWLETNKLCPICKQAIDGHDDAIDGHDDAIDGQEGGAVLMVDLDEEAGRVDEGADQEATENRLAEPEVDYDEDESLLRVV